MLTSDQAVTPAEKAAFEENGFHVVRGALTPGEVETYREACDCRKPGIGMAGRVLCRLGVPESSPRWVVGDKMSDILMGVRLGARTILVGTGYGERERAEGERLGVAPGGRDGAGVGREGPLWSVPVYRDTLLGVHLIGGSLRW